MIAAAPVTDTIKRARTPANPFTESVIEFAVAETLDREAVGGADAAGLS